MSDPWKLVPDHVAIIELPDGTRLYRGNLLCGCGHPFTVHMVPTELCADALCPCMRFATKVGALVFVVRPDLIERFVPESAA